MAAVDRMTEVSSWSTICSSEGDDSDRASVTRRGSLTLSEPASPTHATAMATHTIAKRVSLSPQGDKGHQGELLGPVSHSHDPPPRHTSGLSFIAPSLRPADVMAH